MILPPVVRVFFAVDIPEPVKAKISQYIEQLRKLSKSHQIRWSRPENLHITLQFLAEVQGDDVDKLITHVSRALVGIMPKIALSLKGLHVFPDPHRPRVLVIDVAPQDELAKLSQLIGQGVVDAGYEIEKRAYRAHITIGRLKTAQKSALNFLVDVPAVPAIKFDNEEVVLFQSEPHPDGSHYIPLHRIAFKEKAH